MEFDVATLLLLAFSGLCAGFIDAIAGGGGLITLPVLLASGVPPAQALGTNKLQACFGSFSATSYFLRRGYIDLASACWAVPLTFIGSGLGTLLVQQLDTALLTPLLPILLIGLAIYVLLSPRLGDGDSRRRLGIRAFAFSAGLGIGFYDGCFGPGTGSFFAIAFVTLAGFNLAKATAHSKLLNFTSNLAALIGFALGGKVLWSVGLCMAAGQFVGARLGARMVIRQGSQLIRPLVVLVSLLMSAKLLWSHWL